MPQKQKKAAKGLLTEKHPKIDKNLPAEMKFTYPKKENDGNTVLYPVPTEGGGEKVIQRGSTLFYYRHPVLLDTLADATALQSKRLPPLQQQRSFTFHGTDFQPD